MQVLITPTAYTATTSLSEPGGPRADAVVVDIHKDGAVSISCSNFFDVFVPQQLDKHDATDGNPLPWLRVQVRVEEIGSLVHSKRVRYVDIGVLTVE